MRRITMIGILAALAASATLFAAEPVLGRNLVDRGTWIEVEGSLVDQDGEWALKAKDKTYDLHLGNYPVLYPEGLSLKEGDKAKVTGYAVGEDISAVSLTVGSKTYAFREKDGTPLWAGRGNRGAWDRDDDRYGRMDGMGRMSRGYDDYPRSTARRPMMGGRGRW